MLNTSAAEVLDVIAVAVELHAFPCTNMSIGGLQLSEHSRQNK